MNKQVGLGIAVAMIAGAVLGACTTTAAVEGQFNARSAEASSLRNIAILQFTGENGDAFGRDLQGKLQSATSEGKPWFNIASGDVMKARSGASGTDAQAIATAAAFGKQNRVDGVYFGRTDSAIEQTAFQEERSQCLDKKCNSKNVYRVNCTKVTASFTVFPQILNVKTNALAYAKTISKSATESFCSDRVRASTDGALLGAAISSAATELRQDVAPFARTLKVEVKNAPDKITNEQKDQFNGAVAFVAAGRMDRACGIWESLQPDLENSIELIYNLGVCAEVNGDFTRALEYYTTADGKLTQPDAMINRALIRAKALSEGKEAPSEEPSLTQSLTNMFNF